MTQESNSNTAKITISNNEESDSFLSVMLTLLGVIQGLALNHLADSSSKSFDELASMTPSVIVNTVVCFMIIVRVFQTYYTAAEEKVPNGLDVIDLIMIFLVGLLQYWIINAVACPYTDAIPVTARVSVLGIVAVLLHIKTTVQLLCKSIGPDNKDLNKKLLWSEVWNIPISVGIAALGLYAYHSNSGRGLEYQPIIMGSIATLLLIMITASLLYSNRIKKIRDKYSVLAQASQSPQV